MIHIPLVHGICFGVVCAFAAGLAVYHYMKEKHEKEKQMLQLTSEGSFPSAKSPKCDYCEISCAVKKVPGSDYVVCNTCYKSYCGSSKSPQCRNCSKPAVSFKNCEHKIFCRSCLKYYQGKDVKCPECRKDL